MIQYDRWTPVRKAEALEALARGRIDRAEFMRVNRMTDEELAEWERGAACGNLKVSGTAGRTAAVKARAKAGLT